MSISLARLLADIDPTTVEYRGCSPDDVVDTIHSDSREVTPGSAFIAVRGTANDGHQFCTSALENGAKVLIVERDAELSTSIPCVILPNTTTHLGMLAANAFDHPARSMTMVGITGTNGKTTTAHLMSSLFDGAGIPHARLGTTGHWLVTNEVSTNRTTPFPIELQRALRLARNRGAQAAVMEASSHGLSQHRIDPMLFNAVAITSFSQDHLDFHGTMDAYLDAKLRLVREYLAPQATAIAAIDGHPGCARFLAEAQHHGATTWSVSQASASADIYASDINFEGTRTTARIHTPAGAHAVVTPLIGSYNLDNLLVAIGLGLASGLRFEQIIAAIPHAIGAPGRLQRIEVPGARGPQVIVDYSHTPDAVRRALEAVRPLTSGRVFIVLGCGGDRDPGKRPLMAAAAIQGADELWATSDNPRSEDPDAILDDMLQNVAFSCVRRDPDRAAAIQAAIHAAKPNDLVLIAGKGHETYQIVENRTLHFDDREQARIALQKIADARAV